MKRTLEICVLLAVAVTCASCGNSQAPAKTEAAAPVAPQAPENIQKAAENDLGSESDVIVWGDLAMNGKTQALVVNRLKVMPKTATPGLLVSRASVIENDDGKWKEIFRCDEHLENPKGYLGRQPIAEVGTWRLQYEQDPKKGLQMYFTPLNQPAGGYIQTLGVRWNPEVKRYETMDQSYEHFLTEQPTLEIPTLPERM
ncbi:MAG TPA: hypothetical protein VGR36_00950 [Candidatus Acidoferrales bacterium]|nr:hypothetical protein [Candidatus Acidoferrales bacterium]